MLIYFSSPKKNYLSCWVVHIIGVLNLQEILSVLRKKQTKKRNIVISWVYITQILETKAKVKLQFLCLQVKWLFVLGLFNKLVWATSLTLVLVKNEPSCFFTLFAYLHSSDVEEWPRCIFLIRKTPESWGTDFCSVGLCSDKREKALWKIVC